MAVYPVIMCGGAGTRLWPASRPSRPKQFIRLLGAASPFQETVRRVVAIKDARPPVIVGAVAHQSWIELQLAELGVDGVLILEPTPRDSGPAMTAAATWIADTDPAGVAVVVASDHHIPDDAAFRRAIDTAVEGARDGWIVTLGVTPSGPATSYGYIEAGAAAGGVRKVAAFVEKPDAATARAYVASGRLWNSGNFIVQARTFMEELQRHAPEVKTAVRRALDEGRREGPALHLGSCFAETPRISIDYALMEKTDCAAVLPVHFDWSDVGAWDAVHDVSPHDADGNAFQGAAILEGARDCLVRAEGGMVVAAVGVSNLAIIAEPDAVLVCDLASSQQVKLVVERLKAERRPQIDVAAAPDLADLAPGYLRWLRCGVLPLWWALGADHERGGFHEQLDREGRPIASARHAGRQARVIAAYAAAAAQGWPGPWRQAAEHGLRWLREHHRRPDGLYRASVTVAGAPVEEAVQPEDQAWILLALAALQRAQPERDELAAEAESLLRHVTRTFGKPADAPHQDGAEDVAAEAERLRAALVRREADPAWRQDAARALASLEGRREPASADSLHPLVAAGIVLESVLGRP
jgi:mannose-1-phosphate guanylyltransferase/mannose-6-phosphate isomerase